MSQTFYAKLLVKEDFDAMGCDEPGCQDPNHDSLYLHAQCHPDIPVLVRYEKKSGQVVIACSICRDEVARIAPASRGKLR